MIGFKGFLLLSFIFNFHTFKYGLSNIWKKHSYIRDLYIKNSMQYTTFTSDECCKLVKYNYNNDNIIIERTIILKNKNPNFVNNYFKNVNNYIDNDTINSKIETNSFTEPIKIIMWAS